MKAQWVLIAILMIVGMTAEAITAFHLPAGAVQAVSQVPVGAITPELGAQLAPVIPALIAPSGLNPAAGPVIAKAKPMIEACNVSSKKASNICVAATSPAIQTGIIAVTGIMSAIDMASSTSQSCKKFGDAMDIAKTAMTAYTAACSVVQMNCDKTCGPLGEVLSEAKAAGVSTSLQDAAYISTMKICAGYKLSIVAAGAGLMSILSESLLAGKCEKDTLAVDCVKDPMNATCVKALDCSKPENVSNTACICQRAPNTAGCSTYTGQNNNGVPSSETSTTVDLDAGRLDLSAPNLGSDGMISPTSGPSAGGNGVAPGGGGGGGGNGFSGGADGNKGAQKPQGKGLNANILSGYEGGGGGGSRGGGSYGSGSNSDSGLQAYLPKGAKDPARNPAMQLFGNGQVTGAGSKSNFEKVNERYGDAKGTLIGP